MPYNASKMQWVVAPAIANFTGGAWSTAKDTAINNLLAALRLAGVVNPSGSTAYNAERTRGYAVAAIADFAVDGVSTAGKQTAINSILAALRIVGIVNPSGSGTYSAGRARKFLVAPIADLAAAYPTPGYSATEEAKINSVLAACRVAGILVP